MLPFLQHSIKPPPPPPPSSSTFQSMESSASFSPPPASHSPSADQYGQAQKIADRILRALRHPLRLIHRSAADFFVLGSTGNVYKVTLAAAHACTCPDRTAPCKHILFVILRVLGSSLDDACLWRPRMLSSFQLARLLAAPTATGVVAGTRARERFHQLFGGGDNDGYGGERYCLAATAVRDDGGDDMRDDGACPVCLDEMDGGAELVRCGTCGNALHAACWARWRRSRGRRGAICVMCRAQWRRRVRREQSPYINLAAYVSEEEGMMTAESSVASCTGGGG